MDNRVFEVNLKSLSAFNPRLSSALCGRAGAKSFYAFSKSRSADTIPEIVLPAGETISLHSTVDPKREAERLISTAADDTGFFVFLGLGGGFAINAALENTAARALVIDYDIDSVACLLSSIDYTKLFEDRHFTLCVDYSREEIKNIIMEKYNPALFGGIKIIPLRARTERDMPKFDDAAAAIQDAIKNVSADYSVQAHFGKRWFSNIIRNLKNAGNAAENFPFKNLRPVKEAAIAAAGPSLDQQIPFLVDFKKRGGFIISSDTALPSLLHNNIEPDAAVSIDCQHISYYHFMSCNLRRDSRKPRGIPLFLDIASPPLLSDFSPSPVFFSSAHPLAMYVSQYWQPLPRLDTSGGNVTYACLSLAESLGAERVTLFGADFSYVQSRSYARGTYIYPFFEKKQNRLSTMETLFSSFLYRSPFLPRENAAKKQNYYETAQLRFYREKLEEKAAAIRADITAAQGQGAPINLPQKKAHNASSAAPFFLKNSKAKTSAREFLEQYRGAIASLAAAKDADSYINARPEKERQVFTTLLPVAAALKHRSPHLKTAGLMEEVKHFCINKIDLVLSSEYE